MNPAAHFYSTSNLEPSELAIPINSLVFHGNPIDDRGRLAIQLNNAESHHRILVSYDVETMAVKIGEKSVSADSCEILIQEHLDDRPIVLEATTLGFAELFCIVRALIALGIKVFTTIYVEPANYTKPVGGNSFALSELIADYRPIPHSIVDLASDEVSAGVFFLGYEPERMARALEEFQMISSKEIKVVFGVPAFRAGWELNAIVPHLSILSEQGSIDVAYCSANEPGSAFDCLEKTRLSLSAGDKMFIAPIGTKPCGIATAVFCSLYPSETGIIYDHPKRKSKRSSGVNLWHKYSVNIG
ncbi:MAG TPA: hypothetical protein VE092_01320 [Herbaspirillum sp.]|uniref:hypothetical protein n=1 Tax=Herbaspirillum sp. TaxID=1890675 RepID=UPI002D4E9DFF|nr:hypothetical protein [Herbaspirillum sp.]HZG18626.1 hypothetical protein [Herbaspirillum sp.]